MEPYNSSTIRNLGRMLSVKGNSKLLDELYGSFVRLKEDDIAGNILFDGCNVKKLQDTHQISFWGNPPYRYAVMTKETRDWIAASSGTPQYITDSTVKQYVDRLEDNVNDYLKSSDDYGKLQYLKGIKSSVRDISEAMHQGVVNLRHNVEDDFQYLEDEKLKKEHLERYFLLNTRLISLKDNTCDFLNSTKIMEVCELSDDRDLNLHISICLQNLSRDGNELMDVLKEIQKDLGIVRQRVSVMDKVHWLKKHIEEGDLCDITVSNLSICLKKWTRFPLPVTKRVPFPVPLSGLLDESINIKASFADYARKKEIAWKKKEKVPPINEKYLNLSKKKRTIYNWPKMLQQFRESGLDLYHFVEKYNNGKKRDERDNVNIALHLAALFGDKMDFYNGWIELKEKKIRIIKYKEINNGGSQQTIV